MTAFESLSSSQPSSKPKSVLPSSADCPLRMVSQTCRSLCILASSYRRVMGEAYDWYEDLFFDASASQVWHTSYGPQVAQLTVPPLALAHSTSIQHGKPLHPGHHLHITTQYACQLPVQSGILSCQVTVYMLIQHGRFKEKWEARLALGTPQMMSRQPDSACWAYCEKWSVGEKASEGATEWVCKSGWVSE